MKTQLVHAFGKLKSHRECPVCFEALVNPVVCSNNTHPHPLCGACFDEYINSHVHKRPLRPLFEAPFAGRPRGLFSALSGISGTKHGR